MLSDNEPLTDGTRGALTNDMRKRIMNTLIYHQSEMVVYTQSLTPLLRQSKMALEKYDVLDTDKYMNTKQLSKYIGLSRWSIYKLIRNMELPCISLSKRKILFDKVVIDKWLESRKIKTAKELNR